MKKFITILALLASTLLTDLHWSVLQTVTWISMIQTSEAPISFSEKIVSTITGEDPCDHCIALGEEQGSNEEELLNLLAKGPILAPISSSNFPLSHSGQELFSLRHGDTEPLSVPPPGIEHPPRV